MANKQDEKQQSTEPSQSSLKPKQRPPITPDREKMSRALGAAFLQHKVQQLEQNLDNLSFKRDLHYPPPTRNLHQSAHPQNNSNRNQSKKKTSVQSDPTTSIPSAPPPIKVIDTSMLIHALPILKKWVREAKYKIVIPLDVVSELDFLKTSSPPIHGLVREATSWLDRQFQSSSRQPQASHKQGQACLIAQQTGDESSWEELSKQFIPPPLEVASIPFIKELTSQDGEEEEEPELDYRTLISTDLPDQYRSLLQCALYYQLHSLPNQDSELVMFISEKAIMRPTSKPSHHYQSRSDSEWKSDDKVPRENQDEEQIDKSVELMEWAHTFKVKILKLGSKDLSQAKQWIRNYNQNVQQQQSTHASLRNTNSTVNSISPSSNGRQSAPQPSSSSTPGKRLFVW
ncbi:hypothetical protein PSHT_05179 [Puccinia striiformis]|uniref:PIN domain-containing protein n=1 Tax=Puccinia striiformis TaxID=27350 RepID=A0A2S4WB43_9BASI|nr:hypothetical protein PSHT_05179 [Puccinia striiformis]